MTYANTKGRQEAVLRVSKKMQKVDKAARKIFGGRLKRRRQELQLTQLDVASATEQTYFTFISNVEAGGAKIPSKDLHLWAKILECDLQEFTKSYLAAVDPHLFGCLYAPNDRKTIL